MPILLPEKYLDTNLLLYMGKSQPSSVYYGDTEIHKIYFGSTLVYEKSVPEGETWVLNETLTLQAQKATINFTSNNQNFTSIAITNTTLSYNDIDVYNKFVPGGSHWISGEAYRTITFSITPTDDLLTWLQANGVKQ